ncbi:MAG: HD domain-containing protein [Desulfomicrobium apsheronum]|nr:HD domain-containing protein [Desulfomicrobium apsheronum]
MSIESLCQARDLYRNVNADPGHSPAWFSARMDDWVRTACQIRLTSGGGTLVLALGGYGRGQLFPYSDIDLLVCLPESGAPDPELLAQDLFLPLWDSGFDVGHGIRTVSETITLATADFEVLCSLLDARLLHGSAELFSDFQAAVARDLVIPLRVELLSWLAERHEARHERFGDTAHLLSPNLKEGRGGQRDHQTTQWLKTVCRMGGDSLPLLSPSEREALSRSAEFTSMARVALHRVSKRKNDVLHLELQPEIAQLIGYGPATDRDSVERFLSGLHKAMAETRLLCRLCLDKARVVAGGAASGTPSAPAGLDFSILVADPANVLELFRHSAQTGIPIGWHTRRIIQDRFPALSRDLNWQKPIVLRFEEILCSAHAGHALDQMLEVGFLNLFVPEFLAIEHLVQFDAYHKLPAGPHLVETVRNLAAFTPEHEFLGGFLHSLRSDPCLRWAALLHDIGKGNGDHAVKGAQLSRLILDRLGYDDDFVQECAFLIEHHLLLVHTATRHDLGEESVVMELAQTLGSVRRLDLLTLLTWADSMATGPKAWNPWIENLLRETYFKTRKVLEHGIMSDETLVHRLSTLRDALRSSRPSHFSIRDFERFLSVMPARYLMQTAPKRIIEHIEQVHAFRENPDCGPFHLSWEHRPHSRSLRVTLVSTDRPGLFARVCAALVRHGMSVLGAELCVWDDKTVMDVFWVTEPLDMLYADQTVEAFQSSLFGLLADENRLDQLPVQITTRLRKVFALDRDLVSVRLDNGVSDFYTVLSIEAPDVPGLLATVSLCLYRLGVDLVFAKIATQKDKAMDILHIREGGEKIPDSECESLERTLCLLIRSLYA